MHNPYLRGVKNTKALFAYIKYYLQASSKHDIHSPFVFELLTTVIENKDQDPAFIEIEKLRKALRASIREIDLQDLGAGSSVMKGRRRKISEIVRYSAKSPKYAQLLFRLAAHFQPAEILELGTSLGISSLYLALGNTKANVRTLEGSAALAEMAKENFEKLHVKNIGVIEGNFDDTLPAYIRTVNKLDLVFFDGNHRKEPTLDYFRMCLTKKHSGSLFIFDDIHWSEEMAEAWEEIKANPEVSISIDLHQLGLVFFRTGKEKQHFTIRF
jgi:predicted O-methyltransferase YrrM